MNVDLQLAAQLHAMVGKAERALRAAERHLEEHDYDFASSKAYYAVFHVLQAALLTKQLTFSKHAGVISGFSEHFLKPGLFPGDFGQKIQRLRKDREMGDYGYALTVEPRDAQEDVQIAAQIFSIIKAYLKPFLPS
ncbi:MAG: HEPN domain-containing protein [Candidatus Omnitrophota bacterium]|nr:HEPN domain-containing protein [Candidatus Omnitrophota bacterium]